MGEGPQMTTKKTLIMKEVKDIQPHTLILIMSAVGVWQLKLEVII